jgi:transcriptional enhancer factor
LTEAHSNGKLDSLNIADLASWHHEYPEFGFLQSETENWMRSGQKVLVCTASIQAMTEVRPDADLTIAFDLHSHLDLSRYDYLECMTNFYDNGKSAVDLKFDSTDRDKKERSTTCEYQPDPHGSNGVLRIDFGAVFWTVRMRQYQNMSHRDDRSVGDSLQHLTALQDIYGIVPGTGEARCLCTILWKFQQPMNSVDVCSMEWHSISFAKCRPAAEERWCHEAKYQTEDLGDVEVEHEQITNAPTSTPTDTTPYQQALQLPVDLAQTHATHHPYKIKPHHERYPPPLSIYILGSMQPDLDHLDGSAATTTTDCSQQSFALPHNQGTLLSNAHDNDFDFDGGLIAIRGDFEPTMSISAYGRFPSQNTRLEGSHSLAGLEHDEFAAMGLAIGEHGQLVPVNANDLHDSTDLACYSTKPNWQHAHLISNLENTAEQYHPYIGPDDHMQRTQNHENSHGHDVYQQIIEMEKSAATGLHDVHAHANYSLWGLQGLQSPFQKGSDSGSVSGLNYRKEQAHSSEFGVPDAVERNQRGKSY